MPEETSSYRPLCLIDCTGKLYEKIIDNRLRDILEFNSDNQFGFRKGRSKLDALTEISKLAKESYASYNFRTANARYS